MVERNPNFNFKESIGSLRGGDGKGKPPANIPMINFTTVTTFNDTKTK